MKTKPIPEGMHTVTPYLCVENGEEAMEFYKKAFGAEERYMFKMPDGRLAHAEMRIGDSVIMFAEEHPEMDWHTLKNLNGFSVNLYVYVENIDEFFKKAIAAGAKQLKPVQDQFYGDRSGLLEDPFGHHWWIAKHVEDVEPDELKKRAEKMMASQM